MPHMPDSGLHTTSITSLPLAYRGKVRDIYTIDEHHWLIIATDRVSAFDVILPNTIPDKGKLLTELALFWFARTASAVPNHLASLALETVLPDPNEYAQAVGRCMIAKRLTPLPIEAVVRGYLIGSGWKDYMASQSVCGIELPAGLKQADQLPDVIFTPATKAEVGDHDENISFEQMADIIGADLATQQRGILISDTKFEFGLDNAGTLTLMDEILTPDSSRFWDAENWQPGTSPASYDKQFVRDWLETLDWDKTAPGPELPDSVISGTLSRYQEAVQRLTR